MRYVVLGIVLLLIKQDLCENPLVNLNGFSKQITRLEKDGLTIAWIFSLDFSSLIIFDARLITSFMDSAAFCHALLSLSRSL